MNETDYDSMSVHELLDDYAAWHETCVAGVAGILADIESALRRKAVEEASVGTGTFTGEYGIGMYGEYEPQEGFSVNVEGEHEPEIVYDLIPRVKA